jgi:hypothetical protein
MVPRCCPVRCPQRQNEPIAVFFQQQNLAAPLPHCPVRCCPVRCPQRQNEPIAVFSQQQNLAKNAVSANSEPKSLRTGAILPMPKKQKLPVTHPIPSQHPIPSTKLPAHLGCPLIRLNSTPRLPRSSTPQMLSTLPFCQGQ